MYIGHVAIYTKNLEVMTDFYCKYFDGKMFFDTPYGDLESRYISFDENCYLELMRTPDVTEAAYGPGEEKLGFTHISLYTESSEKLRELTARIEADGYTILSQPTDYGTDIFYESVFLDPDGNRVELGVSFENLKKEHEAAANK